MEWLWLIFIGILATLMGVVCRRYVISLIGHLGGADLRFRLAMMFLKGEWVDKDLHVALQWLRSATAAGHLRAPLVIGMLFAIGDEVERDPVQGYAWLVYGSRRLPESFQSEVAEQIEILEGVLTPQGLIAGEKMIDELEAASRSRGKGFLTLRKAAESGVASAQGVLGEKHYQRKEFDAARQWFEKAAAKGNADALFRLGEMYQFGRGVQLSHEKSVEHLEQAAKKGHEAARAALSGKWSESDPAVRQQQLAELQQIARDLKEEIRLGEEEAQRMETDPDFAEKKRQESLAFVQMQEELPAVVRTGNVTRLGELLADGKITANEELAGGKTLLFLAALLDQVAMVRYLLERGADTAIETIPEKCYPLHAAGMNPENKHGAEIARLLIEFHRSRDEVPPDLRSAQGMTPLMYAANSGLAEVVALLLSAGADPNARDNLGMTPLHLAIDGRSKAVTKLLVAAGADLSARTTPEAVGGAETPIERARRFAPELVPLL